MTENCTEVSVFTTHDDTSFSAEIVSSAGRSAQVR